MGVITQLLRTILAVDTVLGAIFMPLLVLMVIGCLVAGEIVAAVTFAAVLILGGIIYGRYWRRFPFGKFPEI